MATRYTLTGNLCDLLGADASRIVATLRTNLGDKALVDLDTNKTAVKTTTRLDLDANGGFSISLIGTNSAGININGGTLRYCVDVRWFDSDGNPQRWTSGYFTLTGPADLATKISTATGPTYDALTARIQELANAAVAAAISDQMPGAVLGPKTRTDPFSSTNASPTSSTGDIAGLTQNVTGNGRPVRISVYLPSVYHATAGTKVNAGITVDGDILSPLGGQLSGVTSPNTDQGPPLILERTTTNLTAGQVYSIGVRMWSAGGNLAVLAATYAPLQLHITRC